MLAIAMAAMGITSTAITQTRSDSSINPSNFSQAGTLNPSYGRKSITLERWSLSGNRKRPQGPLKKELHLGVQQGVEGLGLRV